MFSPLSLCLFVCCLFVCLFVRKITEKHSWCVRMEAIQHRWSSRDFVYIIFFHLNGHFFIVFPGNNSCMLIFQKIRHASGDLFPWVCESWCSLIESKESAGPWRRYRITTEGHSSSWHNSNWCRAPDGWSSGSTTLRHQVSHCFLNSCDSLTLTALFYTSNPKSVPCTDLNHRQNNVKIIRDRIKWSNEFNLFVLLQLRRLFSKITVVSWYCHYGKKGVTN